MRGSEILRQVLMLLPMEDIDLAQIKLATLIPPWPLATFGPRNKGA